MQSPPLIMRAAGCALVLVQFDEGLPCVVHWGADPGPLNDGEWTAIGSDERPDSAQPDVGDEVGARLLRLIPTDAERYMGRPGLSGSRDAAALPLRFTARCGSVRTTSSGTQMLIIEACDSEAGLVLRVVVVMTRSGLVGMRASLRNTADSDFEVADLNLSLPVAPRDGDVLDLTGRWARERSPQRRPYHLGGHVRESRHGRTGLDATTLLAVGDTGFGFGTGRVHGVHVGWSGNHRHFVERDADGPGVLGGSELLSPGEVRLARGEIYRTPWVYFSYSDNGLDLLSDRFHEAIRSRTTHPKSPRPLTFNTWEAVHFDHGPGRLFPLVDAAASIGAERFVLDDGWFSSRRSDRSGLGDWWVSKDVWPAGLRPLADLVHARGMQFGLWFEPEMVNADSDLARTHPDWIMGAPSRRPVLIRHQWLLDLGNTDAWHHVLGQLDAVITESAVDYVKWDHNRDLTEAVRSIGGGRYGPAIHRQTLAAYALIDELRRRHPRLEIESCSAGGGRTDLGIASRTDRVWASDTHDPIERQQIQRWTATTLPLEMIGTHVGPAQVADTGRTADLSFRIVTALFGHAGIEWDVTKISSDETRALKGFASLYKELRPLLHEGRLHRLDLPDTDGSMYGVVSRDGTAAVFAYTRLTSSPAVRPAPVRLPGLRADEHFRVRTDARVAMARVDSPLPRWLANPTGEVMAGGRLSEIGLQLPSLAPSQAILIRIEQVPAASDGVSRAS